MREGPCVRFQLPLAALVLGFAGCTFTVGRLELATTRAADPGLLRRTPTAARLAVGRSCVSVLVFFPVSRLPSLTRAIDEALDAAGGTVIRDVVIRYRLVYLPFFFGRGCYEVEGAVS
jgi:hypothetical protein